MDGIPAQDRRKRHETRHALPGVVGLVANTPVHVVNVSLGGVGLECPQSMRVGKRYAVTLSAHGEILDFLGTVRWCRIAISKTTVGTPPSYTVGMSFDGLGTDHVAALYAFIGAELAQTVS